MMNDQEKSDLSILAVKSANKGGKLPAESMERREGAEGNTEGSSRQGCNLAGESPAVPIAHVGHVAMPHPGLGNHLGDAWCIRPGRPVDTTAVGAIWRPSECGSLKIIE